MKNFSILIASLVLLPALATGCGKKEEKSPPATKPAAAGSAAAAAAKMAAAAGSAAAAAGSAAMAAGSAAMAAGSAAVAAGNVDYMAGQSTGAKTEDVAGTMKDAMYRNTLVDREIGVAVMCPPDKTWKCKLAADKKFEIQDMSSNTLTVRVASGKDAAEALKNEIAYAKATHPEVKENKSDATSATLDVGPNPAWASPVPRTLWIGIKELGGKFFACHGFGSTGNFENAASDYQEMCNSVVAPT